MKHMRNIANFYRKTHLSNDLPPYLEDFLTRKCNIVIISDYCHLVGPNNKFFITECQSSFIRKSSFYIGPS